MIFYGEIVVLVRRGSTDVLFLPLQKLYTKYIILVITK